MKRMMVVLLGVFIIMLCIMPTMAKKPGDTEEELVVQGPDATASIPSVSPADTMNAPTGLISGSVDTQSPVLDGSAYTNYDTVFVHGLNAVADVNDVDIERVDYYGSGLDTLLRAKISSLYPMVKIYCPMPGYDKKTGGVIPRVRYIGIEYVSGLGQNDYAYPQVYYVSVYNGRTRVKDVDIIFATNGHWDLQVIDLGAWYPFNRGLNIALSVRNGAPNDLSFYVGGYGARYEW